MSLLKPRHCQHCGRMRDRGKVYRYRRYGGYFCRDQGACCRAFHLKWQIEHGMTAEEEHQMVAERVAAKLAELRSQSRCRRCPVSAPPHRPSSLECLWCTRCQCLHDDPVCPDGRRELRGCGQCHLYYPRGTHAHEPAMRGSG